jgi:hypothetical protein
MDQRCASHATICYGFIVIFVVKNAHRDGSLYPHGHRPNGPHERFPHLVPVPRASDDLDASHGSPISRHHEVGARGRIGHDLLGEAISGLSRQGTPS